MEAGDKQVNLDDLKAVYEKQNGNIAPTETTATASSPHPAGSNFYYGGVLYQATVDISSGGTIAPNTNCMPAPLGGQVADLKSAINSGLLVSVENSLTWTKGGLTSSNGTTNTNSNRYRTDYLTKSDYFGFDIAANYWYAIYVYDSNQTYLGNYNGSGYVKSPVQQTGQMLIGSIPDSYYIRLLIGRSDDATVTDTDKAALKILVTADTSLTMPGKAADAKATGDVISALKNTVKQNMTEYSVDPSTVTGFLYTIDSANKWYYIANGSSRGSCIMIPPKAKKVRVVSEADGGVYAFLSDFSPANNTTPAFSVEAPARIVKDAGTYEFDIADDMRYLYFLKINSSGTNLSPASIVFYLQESFYDANLYPYEINDYAAGGIDYAGDGSNTSTTTRIRTNNYHKICHNYLLCIDARHVFKVCYYDTNLNYLGCTADWVRSAIAKETDFAGAQYFRLVFGQFNTSNTLSIESFSPSPKIMITDNPIEFDKYTVLTQDVPKNIGVLNCICRAKQVSMIPYTTAAVMPNQDGDTAADTSVKGVPYSSVRVEGLYVPNCVTLDSFMTAVLNPNSYIYTKQLDTPNAKTYIGSVCSAMVSYSYGLPAVYTTHQIGALDDVELVEDQSVYGLELGHMLLRTNVHIALCTGIWRDSYGRIKQIEITEAIEPRVVTHFFTPASLKTRFFNNNFKIYRYKPIYAVDYTPSPWVHLLDEPQTVPTYNTNLAPRRGDKANWRFGEDVEIDVTDAGNYTSYKLYMGDTLTDTQTIPAGNVITLSSLTAGNYKVCLTDGENDSDFVYFAVVDAECTVLDQGSGVAKVSFTCSANATPAWIAWCYTSGSDIYAAKFVEVISDTDRTNGYIISTYQAGTYLFKVYVRTEYGDYASANTESITIT